MSKHDKYVFEKLTPISDSDLGIYEDALDFVFENDDVKNVAISGAYGAGKSSVLESYKNKLRDKKYIHISLAHFSENAESNGETFIKESVLEGKILNQLIHQIPSDKIPQTNFKIKKSIKRCQSIATTLLVLLFSIAALTFVFFNKWIAIVSDVKTKWLRSILDISTTSEARLLIGLVAVVISVFFVYKIIQIQKNKHILRKLSVQGNEIEIFEKTEESYFDKYLNEVLYLFENVGADVIVFEDMDRFDANRIFERLREVNTLTNLQRKKEGKGIIRFFYLLRDDIFVSKDRTKFFDFIIPVVPVVDGSNSYNQFISHLKKNNLYKEFDKGFLQGLSLYVDDMRLLKNICNEFLVYYYRLNITELDYNKMLALITYKNLFPRDFGDLQLNKGFVYALFQQKDVFIKTEQEKLQGSINKKKTEIDLAKNESLISVQELDDVAAAKKERARYTYGQAWTDYNKWQQNEYPKRKAAIDNKSTEKIQMFERELDDLQQTLQHLISQPLREIISRDNIDSIFSLKTSNEIGKVESYNEIKSNDYFPLLKFLIRNGYIDETYADYMTYFYEDSLSRIDKIYLRSVTDKRAKEYTYELKNPKMVFERLRLVDFDHEETLNNALTDYMIKNARDSEALSHLIEQLKKSKKYAFVEQLLEATTDMPDLISILSEKWPELFSEVLLNGKMSSEHVRKFSVNTLYYANDKAICNINIDGVLAEYISSAPNYLAIDHPKIDRLINGFSVLGIFFPSIYYSASNEELYRAVYENGFYAINYTNIRQILSVYFNVQDENELRKKTSTLIFKNPATPLAKKVENDMVSYLNVVIHECEDEICDDQDVVLNILNNAFVQNDQKIAYIERLRTIISDLSSVKNKELWHAIIENGSVLFSEKNIIDYYLFTKKLDNAIIAFINSSSKTLDFSNLDSTYMPYKRELFNTFVKCYRLSENSYRHAVSSFVEFYDNFDIDNVPESKLKILIENHIIRMNKESLEFIRKNYPDMLEFYIEHNINEYVQIMDEELFSFEELLAVLSMDVSDENKKTLLTWSDKPISIQNKNYTSNIQGYLLQNNLFTGDLPHLYRTYSLLDPELKRITFNLASNNITDIIEEPSAIDKKLKDELMRSAVIDKDYKKKLLVADFSNLTQKQTSNYLILVGKEEFARIFDSSTRPRFENTDYNQELLQGFIDNGWIHEYYQEGDYIKIRRNPPKNKK